MNVSLASMQSGCLLGLF